VNPFNIIVSVILVICGGMLILKENPVGYVLWLAVIIKTVAANRSSQ
jgi:hypothetical protein